MKKAMQLDMTIIACNRQELLAQLLKFSAAITQNYDSYEKNASTKTIHQAKYNVMSVKI